MSPDTVSMVSAILTIVSFMGMLWETWRGNRLRAIFLFLIACFMSLTFLRTFAGQQIEFRVARDVVNRGEQTRLDWSIPLSRGISATLDGRQVGLTGSWTVEPTEDRTYLLHVDSFFGLKADKSITVHVRDTNIDFEIQPNSIVLGQTAKLVWKTNAIRSYTLSNRQE